MVVRNQLIVLLTKGMQYTVEGVSFHSPNVANYIASSLSRGLKVLS